MKRAFSKPATKLSALLTLAVTLACTSPGSAQVTIASVPAELQSNHFTMTINGQPAAVSHAAANYYFANFDFGDQKGEGLKGRGGPAEISITAPTDDYWAKGVEVQPWRWNIRPTIHGRTITFPLDHPAKLSITRPNDHLADAEMFFLFANPPEKDVPAKDAPGVRYYGPGVYHENIDAHSGDTIYLAAGAVIFGSLNLWDVENVKVSGRGTIVYDGPQNPSSDEGWKNQPNWHVIVMHNARHIDISGITCIVRSRTWMIQMRDSRYVNFDNVKVIGGSPGNANQDGMDWLGGGDTVVRDVFIRAADDIFAMYGNWDGYTEEALTAPGHDVDNILIEDSVLSTSISNIVRVGWPKKIFNSKNFTLRNSDVIHMGIGGCGVPFSLFEIWADPAGKGEHSGFLFQDIRLEDWYSLLQLRQPNPSIRDVRLRNIWAIESPSLVPSVLKGEVQGVNIENFKVGDKLVDGAADVPTDVLTSASPPMVSRALTAPLASFTVTPSLIEPGQPVIFDASPSSAHASSFAGHDKLIRYEWFFGDGTTATGRVVNHKFPDAEGTLRDGSGRFRVLLKVTDSLGQTDWSYKPAVVTATLQQAETANEMTPGLAFRYYEGDWTALPDLATLTPTATGTAATVDSSMRKRDDDYAVSFDGFIKIPADGGYTFTLLSRDRGEIRIGPTVVATSPKPVAQVCGSIGNAVQSASGTIGLKAGFHSIHILYSHSTGDNDFAVRWQSATISSATIPAVVLAQPSVSRLEARSMRNR